MSAGTLQAAGALATESKRPAGALTKLIHLARQDLRRLWPWTVLWSGLLVMQAFTHRVAPVGSAAREGAWFSDNGGVLAILFCWVLIPILIQPFRALGSKAFWLTRPMGYRLVLVEKVGFAVILWQGPAQVAQAVALSGYGTDSTELPVFLGQSASHGLFVLAVFVLLSASVRSAWTVAVVTSVFFFGVLTSLGILADALRLNLDPGLLLVLSTGAVHPLASLVLAVAALAVCAVLYRTRSRWVLTVPVLVLGSFITFSQHFQVPVHRPLDEGADALEVAVTRLSEPPGGPVRRGPSGTTPGATFDIDIEIRGLSPTTIAQVSLPRAAVDSSSERRLHRLVGPSSWWIGHEGAFFQATGARLPGGDLRFRPPDRLSLPAELATGPVAELHFALVDLVPRLKLPLRPGARAGSGSFRFELVDLRAVGRKVWLAGHLSRVESYRSEIPFDVYMSPFDWFSVDPVSRTALALAANQSWLGRRSASSDGASDSSPWPSPNAELTTESLITGRPEVTAGRVVLSFEVPETSTVESWLEVGELVLVQNRFLGWKEVRAEIEAPEAGSGAGAPFRDGERPAEEGEG